MKKEPVIKTIAESIALEIKSLEINGKTVKIPFFAPMPSNRLDLDILCETMNPDNIDQSNKEDLTGAVVYKLMEHDSVIKDKLNMSDQMELFGGKSGADGYKYITGMKLKIIDPFMEVYRNRSGPFIAKYRDLKLPTYLDEHFKTLTSADKSALDKVHNAFWSRLKKENRSAHFIKWHYDQQKLRGSDIFLPPVPLLKPSSSQLLDLAIELNSEAYDITSNSTTYFVIDIQIFRNKEIVQKICEYIGYTNTKFNIFKILNPDKLISKGFGQDARKNFEWFLRVIKSLKEEDETRFFGILNGGGFGYCLLGAGWDFFVDTVSNYPQAPFGRGGRRNKYRKILNIDTLSLEPSEGVENILANNGTFLGNNPAINKYRGKTLSEVSPKEWSMDCKRHGIYTWNELVGYVHKSIKEKEDTLCFERFQNSDYAILGNIVRSLNI